jgi:hypothetical protein
VTDIREAMRAAVKGSMVAVDVPDWDQKVYVRSLTARESIDAESRGKTNAESAMRMVLRALVDENGERLLSDSEDDWNLLLDQPVGVLMPLALEAAKLNGGTSEEIREAIEAFANAPEKRSSTE